MNRAPWLSLLALAACTSKPAQTPDQASAPPASSVPVIDISAIDYAYQAPDTLPGGWVTLRLHNNGKELHHASLFRLAAGKTLQDLATVDANKPPPDWLEAVGGPQAPLPGGTLEATLKLEPGSYALICLIPSPDGQPHVAKGMVKPVTVTGGGTAEPPPADITVTLSDFAFGYLPALTAGKHTLRVSSVPGQPHEIVIARLVPGKTADDFLAWVEKPEGPPPIEAIVGGTTPLGGSAVNQFTVDLAPGPYAVICFVPDAKDGKLHAVHGMMQTITL